MKRFFYLSTVCFMILASCDQSKKPAVLESGIDRANLDTTISPRNDFYDYACGGWMKNNPLKPEYARYGTFDQLRENNKKQVNELIEGLAKQQNQVGTIAYKIGSMYNMGMDSLKLNKEGFEPIKNDLQSIAAISDLNQLQTKLAELHRIGVFPFFTLIGEADFTNSSMNIAWLYQHGLGMGDRDYYLDADTHSMNLRAKYRTLLTNMFKYSALVDILKSNKSEEQLADAVIELETKLAKASMSRLDQRDPHKIFNKKKVVELKAIVPTINFSTYFANMGVPSLDSLNVAQPEYFKEISKLISATPLEYLKAYMAWNLINNASGLLSDEAANENFAFYGKALSGKEEMEPRWKRVVDLVNESIGEAVGQMYVEKYFPASSKERMDKLVANLQVALSDRINHLDWMSDETKQKAKEKLVAFRVKIGYPEKWRDYSSLEIKEDSYYANSIRANRFEMDYLLSKIDKPLDPNEWGMTPQTVNAYYNPTTNEICFPAGILQPPFFNPNADDAANYGAIGLVIGHEMTHGFDDQGRQYDKEGNLKNWWTEGDANKFTARAQVLVDFFNTIEVAPGVFAKGDLTLGENIADYGGIQVSWDAMQKAIAEGSIANQIDGFSAAQRFFLAYATVWAGNIREQEILRLTKEDVHSLGRWRVNGALKHIPQFYEAFGVVEGDSMYIAPDKRAVIW